MAEVIKTHETEIVWQEEQLDSILQNWVAEYKANVKSFEYFIDTEKKKVIFKLIIEHETEHTICPKCGKDMTPVDRHMECIYCGYEE